MANIEKVKFDPSNPAATTRTINITASVGANGINKHNDVIIIQALLKYALEGKIRFRREEFPEPCGAFIKSTARLIKKFQRANNRTGNMRKVATDGRIDPIRNSNAFAPGKKKHWTLYSLQVTAMEAALMNGDGTVLDGLCRRWPFLREILNYDGVGTLGLGLE